MHELLQKLTVLVGENNVLTGDAVRQRATSWFDNTPMSAAAIVRPGTTAEVTAVIQCCAEHGVALIPMGGLTGFVEGAVAGDQQIGLSLERLTRIESFDVENRSVVVEAGVPLQALQEAAEAHGLHFPVDLGARGSCTIGGMTATNAGGNEVLRRGMMREQILGMEVVLANGEVLTNLRPLIKNNTGYDLKQLFIGSEGSLGVVTRLCLRLRPKHLSHSTALVATDSFDKVAHLLRHLEGALGGRLSAYEVMWQNHYAFIIDDEQTHKAPLPTDYPFYVLVQAANYHELEADIFQSALEQAMSDELLVDAAVASSLAQQADLWAIRDDIERLTVGLAPYIGYDVSLPIQAMNAYVTDLTETINARWADAKMVVFGHLGDGNLHLFIHIGPELSAEDKEAVNQMVYEPLEALQGSISAEHGIGHQKKRYLKYSRSDTEIAWMRRLKQTFDPENRLNPGVIF
ncbi:FAD-binding oxidoreductase [Reinekea blandensis]|uniref:FAD linked oxidase n=1 Tax=Reinekea blandensis MED297 TaxID=314283 RepID=A4BBB0_9GAMM|nr:FAD-binding oxidoreductase [Reinekea blandensis]EAR10723.1 FAD linked oxidase [Reinekea sp. MED297] [Reinekea blandensis MED297]